MLKVSGWMVKTSDQLVKNQELHNKGEEIDKQLDSTDALDLKDIPKKLLIIGGGYIGLEMGSIYHSLGSEITIVEFLPNPFPF